MEEVEEVKIRGRAKETASKRFEKLEKKAAERSIKSSENE